MYLINVNQTTEFTLERDFYQIGIDLGLCSFQGGTFSRLPAAISLTEDANVSISLDCP